jgi:hypothetical protein
MRETPAIISSGKATHCDTTFGIGTNSLQTKDLFHRSYATMLALSYTWGNKTPYGTILMNEQPFAVARNLLEA